MQEVHNLGEMFGLNGLRIRQIIEQDDAYDIYGEMQIKPQTCPRCGTKTTIVHDYREQKISSLPINGKPVNVHLRKRRYSCPECKKHFYEENEWLEPYQRMTMQQMTEGMKKRQLKQLQKNAEKTK